LAKGCPHCMRNAWGIAVELPLVDDGAFVGMKKLDRVFDGDDVACRALVDLIH